ncbi:hypothetical protein D7X55_00700 [Corallococcus sp. AB049A]|uniref:Uncharacterized protein n=1 Tax=Corallococcus interemptor TaxID=2316720 RepID=A0A3A8QRU8_9BACT|nr:hypothetical protein D7Y23_00265 [Corallococcus sp. AB050B]RKH71486.1 hypothetical protein D7X96_08205 [Corallococcus interemptor]RKI75148.1 hypothetical protein D7X55_00700 [Corallococcus sp. AB049A]
MSLCISGLLLACARGAARSTPSEAALSDDGPVSPCNQEPTRLDTDVQVFITASPANKVHFSTTDVKVGAGQTVQFVSQVNQDRCIVVADAGLLASGSQNPLTVAACGTASWTLLATDKSKDETALWSCPTTSDGGCSHCADAQSIRETINGKLEVTSGGGV